MDKREIVKELEKEKKKFYLEIARHLKKCPGVNVRKIDMLAKENETIIVPGKVIGNGKMSKKIKIYAYGFSAGAEKSIKEANGTTENMESFLKNKEIGRIII